MQGARRKAEKKWPVKAGFVIVEVVEAKDDTGEA